MWIVMFMVESEVTFTDFIYPPLNWIIKNVIIIFIKSLVSLIVSDTLLCIWTACNKNYSHHRKPRPWIQFALKPRRRCIWYRDENKNSGDATFRYPIQHDVYHNMQYIFPFDGDQSSPLIARIIVVAWIDLGIWSFSL